MVLRNSFDDINDMFPKITSTNLLSSRIKSITYKLRVVTAC
jgi:hypothetical protein